MQQMGYLSKNKKMCVYKRRNQIQNTKYKVNDKTHKVHKKSRVHDIRCKVLNIYGEYNQWSMGSQRGGPDTSPGNALSAPGS